MLTLASTLRQLIDVFASSIALNALIMPTDSNSSSPSITSLSNSNYPQWPMEMKAWLMMRGLWMLVSGEEKEPGAAEVAELQDWRLRSQKAAGALFLAIEHEQRIHLGELSQIPLLSGLNSSLCTLHNVLVRVSMPMTLCFSIRKRPDESLQALMNRVDESMRSISNLHPKAFLLQNLDDELACMALSAHF